MSPAGRHWGALAVVCLAVGCRPPEAAIVVPGAAWLEVEVTGVNTTAGAVALALFASEESFRSGGGAERRATLPVDGELRVWRLDHLPVGDYAVKAYLDLNGSGTLDVGPLGAPTEPYGLSNDARGTFGPPRWSRARFRVGADGRRISIALR